MLIRTVMYETFVEIQRLVSELKEFALPTQNGLSVTNTSEEVLGKAPKKIERIVPDNGIVMKLLAKTHEEAIMELISKLKDSKAVKDLELCKKDVMAREAVVSTCIPGGIALPHAKTDGADRLISAIGISREGCPAVGMPNGKTHIFVLSLCPKSSAQPYLQFISRVAKILSKKENVEAIMNADTPERVRAIFLDKKSE